MPRKRTGLKAWLLVGARLLAGFDLVLAQGAASIAPGVQSTPVARTVSEAVSLC